MTTDDEPENGVVVHRLDGYGAEIRCNGTLHWRRERLGERVNISSSWPCGCGKNLRGS